MKEEILEKLLSEAKTICILGHTRPDGDCLGSTLGWRNYLRARFPEKEVTVFLMEANEKFAYLPGFTEIRHDSPKEEHDLALICDCGSYDRLGEYARLAKNAKERYVVDHHITSSGEDFPCHTILPEASSTCEISFDLMDFRYFTKEVATCLYTGIIHDTGVFKYNSTTAHTMEIAGKCMAMGIPFSSIIDDSFYMKTVAEQKITGRVLLDGELYMGGRILASSLSLKDMQSYGADQKDVDGIVSLLRETKGVEGVIFLYEVGSNTYKVSLRSNNTALDVSEVAAHFGGGGHKMAAGCSLKGDVQSILTKLFSELGKQLDE